MVTTARSLIERALRLINVPGRGARLREPALTEAFEALNELLASQAVSNMFVPGIRKHFFTLNSSKAIYKYGVGPSADLRSDNFDDNPAPIRVESAVIRCSGSITNNEQVDEYRFENVGDWTESGTASITNNQADLAGVGSISQVLGLLDGITYTISLYISVNSGSATLQVQGDGSDVLNRVLDASGYYEFDFAFTGTASSVSVTTTSSDDVSLTSLSIVIRGMDRLELANTGYDTPMESMTRTEYSNIASKNDGGTPCRYLYARDYPIPTLYLDNRPTAGDILIADVLVNPMELTDYSSVIRLHGDSILWVRYKLADMLSGEYSKMLSPAQRLVMDEAWDRLAAGNMREERLRCDDGLLANNSRGKYNIFNGD